MLARLQTYASFVRISHSAFALPFALAGALLGSRLTPLSWSHVLWIIACMVSARSAAMGFNRLVDAAYDARNPRTAMRELPRGAMSRREAVVFVGVWSAVFVGCASALGPTCLLLSPVALAIVFWYSLAKRVTFYTQLFLGLAMAIAPVGGWIAIGAPPRVEPWVLGLAIGTWVAGFDVLYACQDVEFDRREGLRSIPVRFGIPRALWVSRVLHGIAVVALAVVGRMAGLGRIYAGGVAAVAVLLVYEQSLVTADDLSQVKRAFDLNGWVGVLYLAATALDVYPHLSVFVMGAPSSSVRHIAVGVTGASGALYAVRTIAALLELECRVDVVFSEFGRRLLMDELGQDAKVERLRDVLAERHGEGTRRGDLVVHSNRDLGAVLASGSHRSDAMVIVPCSMKTLAAVAHGLSRNLIERAADVMLKEKRRLVMVPRETPMSLPALRNLVACAEAGALVLPAMPAFYQRPRTIDDLADFIAGKILNSLGFDQQLFPAWKGE